MQNYLALQKTRTLLQECIRESRRISHDLIPTILEDFGLAAAVKDICERLNGKVRIRCEVSGINNRLDKYMELTIFRIVQELIFNVIKHAESTEASVKVKAVSESLEITVDDNGKGFDITETKNGIGLKIINSKVHLLNGQFQVCTEPGVKTSVRIVLPITIN